MVLDAFCGVGLFSLPLASRAARLIGIEASNSAVADARFNAAAQGFTQAQFHAAEVEALVPELLKQQQVELAVLDPPRKGCAQQVLQALADNKIARVIYVSCNMATLARDIKALTGQGYNLQWIQPVDVFPQTAHIEAVALLEYKGDNSGTGSE